MELLLREVDSIEIEIEEIELRLDAQGRVRPGQILGYRLDGTAARAPMAGRLTRLRYAPDREAFVLTLVRS